MSTEETEKSYCILPFSGKHDDWRMWSRKFLARAKMKKYKDVLTGLEEVPMFDEEIDSATKVGKIKSLARSANDTAYNDLLLSCSDEVSFGAVDEALTSKLPDGDAAKAWNNLVAKFEPKTSASLVQLKKEFNVCTLLSVDKDPDVWLSELERIRQRLKIMQSVITDTDLMIHVLNNLPIEYETLVEKLELEIEAKMNPLTLEGLRAQLRSKYCRYRKHLPVQKQRQH